jgi:hypothetical protein
VEGTPHRSLDLVIGTSALVLEKATAGRRRVEPLVAPLAGLVLRPPVPARLQPAHWLGAMARRLAERGEVQRAVLVQEVSRVLDVLVPVAVADVLRRAGLTEKVIDYVDLDAVVASVDLDAAASRLDVDAVVRRVDLAALLDRLDLTDVVRERVDLDAVVASVDLDAAARQLDIEAVLDRLDLTALVLKRVDLGVLVAAVLDRIDLAGLATQVVDEIDLPEIIRESTGSMASDTVQGVRMQGINADEAVGHAMDRLLLRRRRREEPP